LISTTSSKLLHVPFVIVHRNVTLLAAGKPVNVLTFELGVVIVTPGSVPNTLHMPVPVVGALPAKVKPLVLH